MTDDGDEDDGEEVYLQSEKLCFEKERERWQAGAHIQRPTYLQLSVRCSITSKKKK
jgi:hypothetical protein